MNMATKADLLKPLMLFCFMMQLSCSFVTQSSQNKSTDHGRIKAVSFKGEFQEFWAMANNTTFENQLKLWTSIVEEPHQQFFDFFVWSKRSGDNDFANRRRKQLRNSFKKFKENEAEINEYLGQFENILLEQVTRYQKVFPDFNFPVNCYGIVGGNFLGRVGVAPWNKEKYMAFGIEKVIDMNANTDVLYSHELFHVYHSYKSNIDSAERLVTELWAEGLASYVSFAINPDASKKDIFMYESTARIKNSELSGIAARFLKISGKLTSDPDYGKDYYKWFLSEKDNGEIPVMAGYWLGFKVIEHLNSRYELSEMAEWSTEKADRVVTSILEEFSDQ